ncbi:CDC45 family [Cantharellus anzutake]|uniref:CDC45 family n=1 Tax=Cantharellus anzutake TaxID=1750568 RepID=UPI001908E69A|nr:CDC45 family [Cantharellus anzutake]KAF8334992.1 CDC45 family [Cantharellus anzutake]
MGFVSPDAGSGRARTYEHAYKSILASRRRFPSTSAASVILLVPPEVDALCAARILSTLFKQDDVGYRIIPVSGYQHLEEIRDELVTNQELHTLILINIGSLLDLPSSDWFGDFNSNVAIHVVDSTRPQNLSSLFGTTPEAQRITVWDDGSARNLSEVQAAYESMEMYPGSDSSGSDSEDDSEDYDGESVQGSGNDDIFSSNSNGDSRLPPRRRRRLDASAQNAGPSRLQREEYRARLDKHYSSGIWYGQSASGIIYALSTMLDRADNGLLWRARHPGLTHQYSSFRIPRDRYEGYHAIFNDEVARLNLSVPQPTELNPDDQAIRTCHEFRFSLFRQWNLYDAMFHSSYVANKLGIWQERGRNRLQGLLAKMGFALQQAQQAYQHMDMDLRHSLGQRLENIAPEYGLLELTYPSFLRSYGFRSQPLPASDVVESVSALLQAAGGVRIEVESESGQGGGECPLAERNWSLGDTHDDLGNRDNDKEEGSNDIEQWWMKNFWSAFDALSDDLTLVQRAVPLSKALHRAVVRQGSALIDKRVVRTYRSFKLATTFCQPGTLSRLGLWLSEVLRDRQANMNDRSTRRLPVLVACLNQAEDSFLVVGVPATTEEGDVRKNHFGVAFIEAKERSNARTRQGGTFDTSVIEVKKEDFTTFLEELQLIC